MVKSYYDRYWQKEIFGASQDQPPEWSKSNFDWHYKFFNQYIGKKVLDVGAGNGQFAYLLSQKKSNIKIDCLEISSVAIKSGQENYKQLNFINDSIENPLLKFKKYHTVFLIEVVEHLLDIDMVLKNLCQITQKNGFICITTTDFNLLKRVLIALFSWDKYFYPNNPHIRFFTKNTIIKIFESYNFKFVKHQWNRSYFGIMPKGQMIVFQKK